MYVEDVIELDGILVRVWGDIYTDGIDWYEFWGAREYDKGNVCFDMAGYKLEEGELDEREDLDALVEDNYEYIYETMVSRFEDLV